MQEKTYTTKQLHLTDDELADIASARARYVVRHEWCNGVGEVFDGSSITDCTCMTSLKAYKLLVHARIPGKFRLSDVKYSSVAGVVSGRGMTSALVSELYSAIKRGENCVYCTADQLVAWCRDEKREEHSIWLERLRFSDLIAVDDLHRLSFKYDTPAPGLLRARRDNGARLIGAGQPLEGWDMFEKKIAAPGWKSATDLEFYDLGRVYGTH